MKTSDVLKFINIPRHKLHYLELKGYVIPRRLQKGNSEAKVYSREEVIKIKLIWKYLQQGLKYEVAYQKAREEMTSCD